MPYERRERRPVGLSAVSKNGSSSIERKHSRERFMSMSTLDGPGLQPDGPSLGSLKTAEEVAKVVRMSAERILQLRRAEVVPHFRIDGGEPLFSVPIVKAYVRRYLTVECEGASLPLDCGQWCSSQCRRPHRCHWPWCRGDCMNAPRSRCRLVCTSRLAERRFSMWAKAATSLRDWCSIVRRDGDGNGRCSFPLLNQIF